MPSIKSKGLFYVSQLWLVIVVFLLGVVFRFANLEGKVFWVDEVATTVRVAGYTIPEISNDLQAKDLVSRDDLLGYQLINQDRNLGDTWQALTKSPEHAPLYFLLTRFWLQLWGHSIATMRSLSTYISLLIFPVLYLLVLELFNRPLVSCIGIILMSVSPFYVAYAQEARPYSLWAVTILLMCVSFLRAIRFSSWQIWVLYILSLVLGFYTSLLSLFVACFQGIYLLIVEFKNKSEIIKNYFISNAIALFFFSPWLIIIMTGMQTLQDNTVWMRTSIDLDALIATWLGTILLIFGDLPLAPEANAVQIAIVVITLFVGGIGIFCLARHWHQFQQVTKNLICYVAIAFTCLSLIKIVYFKDDFYLDIVTLIGAIVAVLIVALASYSIYFLINNTKQAQWLFVICLILALPVPLFVADVISQGQSSGAPRYLIPTQLGIQIAAAYTLGTQLENSYLKSILQQKIWQLIIIFFISLGIFSCIRNLNLSPIYLKTRNIHNHAIAKIINYYPDSLVIVEPIMVNDLLSISHDLSEQVKIKVIEHNSDQFLAYKNQFSYLYLLKPSTELKTKLVHNHSINLKQVYQPKLLTPEQFSLDLWLIRSN
jgi:uncharacterized membrane protein